MLWKWLRFAELVIKCAQFLTVEDSDPILDVDWRQGVFWNDVSISNSSQIWLPITFAIDLKCIIPGYTAARCALCYTECICACAICLGRNGAMAHFSTGSDLWHIVIYGILFNVTYINAGSWKQKTKSLWLWAICELWCRHRKHPGHWPY